MNIRAWVNRTSLGLMAVMSFIGGFTTGSWRIAAVVGVVACALAAFVVDWQIDRARAKSVADLGEKLWNYRTALSRDPVKEMLRDLGRTLFHGHREWRVTLYRLEGSSWSRLARAANHEVFEDGGRPSFPERESFMVRFRSRNLEDVVIEGPIRMPDRSLDPQGWRKEQTGDGGLSASVSDVLRMPTGVYYFAAIRLSDMDSSTLAICLEGGVADEVDSLDVQREVRASTFQSLMHLLSVREVTRDAPEVFQKAIDVLGG